MTASTLTEKAIALGEIRNTIARLVATKARLGSAFTADIDELITHFKGELNYRKAMQRGL